MPVTVGQTKLRERRNLFKQLVILWATPVKYDTQERSIKKITYSWCNK